MALDPLTAILNIGNTVIDRLLPDKTANDQAKANLALAAVQGQFQEVIAQLEINKVEAASNSVFVAGWRPAVGWVCAASVAYSYIIQPLLQFSLVAFHVNFDPTKLPQLNMVELLGLLTGMLGFGLARSFDKAQGTDNGH
jgi:holin (3TMs family)